MEITVSYEKGIEGPGGFCRVKGQKMILVNRDLTLQDKIDLLAETLLQFPLDEVYIIPEVREYLEWLRKKNPET